METTDTTTRDERASPRKTQLLAAAARLFAERGFHGVTIEDLGTAAGISGPAVYKHFASKDAVLSEMLVGISEFLLRGARTEVASALAPGDALERLLDFHSDFALTSPDLIRVQDRDLANLSAVEARRVRSLQRSYVEVWVGVLREGDTSLSEAEARTMAHGLFGLLNSTPHSALERDRRDVKETLVRMARGALGVA
jgi:AcrR family transcriptional regulator